MSADYGYIYILSNPSMPGLLKIGRSIHGGVKRSNSLFTTGVPSRFNLEFEIYTCMHSEAEKNAHERLYKFRERMGREFFRIDLPRAIMAVTNSVLSSRGLVAVTVDDAHLLYKNKYSPPGRGLRRWLNACNEDSDPVVACELNTPTIIPKGSL